MKWIDYANHMEQYVIKKDSTAVDIEYFMATHVPFKELEVIEMGNTQGLPIGYSEEEIYNKFVVNTAKKHQMIIVRGSNGTGKSHLICWLHNRYKKDIRNYNPEKEKIIFLRRLDNTIHGAIKQLLDENIIYDEELRKKFSSFVSSESSQSEAELRETIYTEYIKKVRTDISDKYYRTIICQNIADLLSDSRVRDLIMKDGGPVDRCYQMITSGAKTTVTDQTELIFTKQDFKFDRQSVKKIKEEAAIEVSNYYINDLRKYDDEIQKLADYLNHFTSNVVQSCANITSENARDLFVDLRKHLYKEGKSLIIFIEDFTSFSLVQSELITALAVENGGNYSDLCMVTSIIGITDGYYNSFRDNFKDRVTAQINVTENAFSGEDFILEMAARYLNVAYCSRSEVLQWYRNNVANSVVVSDFKPKLQWDCVTINNNQFTIYPFNKKSLLEYYSGLEIKTPRYFLTEVIKRNFLSFAESMEYNDNWRFPELSSFVRKDPLQPPYADTIDNSSLSVIDKKRLKVLLNTWGDGTTNIVGNSIGGIDKEFLDTIGLGSFSGTQTNNNTNGSPIKQVGNGNTYEHGSDTSPISKQEKEFKDRLKDIDYWKDDNKTLGYVADYNLWLKDFIVQAIPWQDEGYPAYFVQKRLLGRKSGLVYIEGASIEEKEKKEEKKAKAIIVLRREPEARTVLKALVFFNFYKNWSFENAAYYQLTLVSWLEKNKHNIKDKVFAQVPERDTDKIIKWCMAFEFVRRVLLRHKSCRYTDIELIKYLLKTVDVEDKGTQLNEVWSDVQIFLKNNKAANNDLHEYLVQGANTTMAVVGERNSSQSNVKVYRTSELQSFLNYLISKNWDLKDELKNYSCGLLEDIGGALSVLYSKANAVLKKEIDLAKSILNRFDRIIGLNLNNESIIDLFKEINVFYSNCDKAHEVYDENVKEGLDAIKKSAVFPENIVSAYNEVKEALTNKSGISLLIFFTKGQLEFLDSLLQYLEKVEITAQNIHNRHLKTINNSTQIDQMLLDKTLDEIEGINKRLKSGVEHAYSIVATNK